MFSLLSRLRKPSFAGLRPRLYCLALLAIVPLGIVRMVERSEEADRALLSAGDLVASLADRGLAAAVGVLDEARGTLEVLTHVPAVRQFGSRECNEYLSRIIESRPWAITITVLDRSAVARCSTGPAAIGVSFADRPYIQQTIEHWLYSVSDLLVARVTKRPTIATAMPIIADNDLRGVIVATLDLEQLDKAVSQVKRKVEGGVGYIVGPGSEHMLSDDLIRRASLSPNGTVIGRGADGVERLYAVRHLPYTQAALIVGMPRAEALAGVVQRDWRTAAEIFSIAILIAAAIGIGGDMLLVRPLRALGRAAIDWGRGDLAARACLPGRPASEFVLLAQSMNAMAERIANREQMLSSARDELVGLAFRDSLTQIANRRYFEQQLAETWEGWMDEGRQLAIVMIDVDFFKFYNDRYGHQAGDVVLRLVADRIQSVSEVHGAFAARLGGEEFGVIVSGDERLACRIAEGIRTAIHALDVEHTGSKIGRVTVSIGCAAVATESARSTSDIMQAADVRLYIAKKLGRNCVAASAELERFAASDDEEPELKNAA
jgi:diguanylate cyclase (GGDEF)-like protein